MFFEAPQSIWFFWVLPILTLAFIYYERRRRQILSSILSPEVIQKRMPDYAPWASILRFVFFAVALLFLGIALLKPYSDLETREVKRRGVDLYFLVDLSKSMLAQDIKPSRIQRARREIVDFIKLLKGDRVGLIGFAGTSYVFVPLTIDYNAFDLFSKELEPDAIPVPGTDIKGALLKALESFKTQSKSSAKAIILITDGEDSVGLNPDTVAEIKKMDLKVFVIGVGTLEGAPIPLADGGYKTDAEGKVVVSKLNEDVLQSLAIQTGGGYVRSVTGDLDLEQIYFKGIKKSFEDADISVHEKKLPHYEFQWAILMGFILLGLEILTTQRRWYWGRLFFGKRTSKNKQKSTPLTLIVGFLLGMGLLFNSPFVMAANPFSVEEANQDYLDKRYEASLEKYLGLLAEHPEDSALHFNLGNTYYQLKKYKEAEESYKKALNSQDLKLRSEALYNLGNAKFRQDDLEGALEHYDQALKMRPKYHAAQKNYDYVKKLLEEKQKEEEQKKDEQKEDEQKDQQDKEEPNKDNQEQQDEDQQDQKNQDQQDKEGGDNKDKNNKDQKDKGQEGQDQNENQEQEQEKDNQKDKGQEGEDQKDNQDHKEQDSGGEEQDKKDDEKEQDKQKNQGQDGDKQDEQEPDTNQDGQEEDNKNQEPEEGGSEHEGSQKQDNSEMQPAGEGNEKQGFKFDGNPDKWLDSVEDEPGTVLRKMIMQQTKPPEQPLGQDW